MENPRRAAAQSDDDEEIYDKRAVFIDTNLDTHLALIVSFDDTVFHLKQKMLSEHTKCFPNIGVIEIHAVKVKRKGRHYYLPESMLVFSVFHGIKTNWFLFAEALSRAGPAFDNRETIDVDDPSRALAIIVRSAVPLLATNQIADQALYASEQLGGGNFMCSHMMVDHNNEDNHEGCSSHNTMSLMSEMLEKLNAGYGNDAAINTHTESMEGGSKKRCKRKKQGSSEDASMKNDEDGVFLQNSFVQKTTSVADLSAKGGSPDCSFTKPGSPGKEELELAPSKCPEIGGSSLRLSNVQGRESGEHKVEDQRRSVDADSGTSTVNKRARKKRKNQEVLEDHHALLATTGSAFGMRNGASDTLTGDVAGVANVITEVACMKNDEDGVFLPHAFVQKDTAAAVNLSAKCGSPDLAFTQPGSPIMLDPEHAPSKWPGMGGASLGLSNIHEMVSGEHKVEEQCRSVDADSGMNTVKRKGRKKQKKQAASDHDLEYHDSMLAASGATSQMGNGVSDNFNDSVAGVANMFIGRHVGEGKSLDAADLSDSLVQRSRDLSVGYKHIGTSDGNADDRTRKRIGDGQNHNLLARVLQSELADEKEGRGGSKISLRNVVPTSAEEVSKQDTKITKHGIGGREILEKEVINSDVLVTKTIDDASLPISNKDKGKKKRERSDSDLENQVSLNVLPSLTAGRGETSDNMVEDGPEKFVKDSKMPAGISTLEEDKNEVPAKFEGTSASVDNTCNSEREADAAAPVPLHGAKKKKKKKDVGDTESHQSPFIEDPEVLKSSETRDVVRGSYDYQKYDGHAADRSALPVTENDANVMAYEHWQLISDGRELNEEVVFSSPPAGKKRKTEKSKMSNADDISTMETITDFPTTDDKENVSLQNKKGSLLGDRILDDRCQTVEVSLQDHEEHEENAVNDGEKRKKRKKKKTLSASLLSNGVDGTMDDLCVSKGPHQLEKLEESAGTNKEQKTKTKRDHDLTATNSVHGVDGKADDDRHNKEVKCLLLSQNAPPEEGRENKAERKKSKKKKTLSASVFANGVDATSNDLCISKGQFQLEQPEESAGNSSEQNRRTEWNQNLAANLSHDVDGGVDDDGQNKEVEPLLLSQNELPEENMGNKTCEPGRETKKQHCVSRSTAAGVKDGEADQRNPNDVEPPPLAKVEKPDGIVEKEIGKPKKTTRRKLNLSGEEPSGSAHIEQQERIKYGTSLDMKTREVDTYKATKEIQSARASSINQLMDAERDVFSADRTNNGGGVSELCPRKKGLSVLEHQINIPQKDKGSNRESPELGVNEFLDAHQQEVASEENRVEFAEEKPGKKLEERDNRKDHGRPSSIDTSATGQSFGKTNRSREKKRTTKDKKEDSIPLSDSKAGASARAVAPTRKNDSKIRNHSHLEGRNQKAGASIARLGNSDREPRPQDMKLDRYRVSFRKPSDTSKEKAPNGFEGKKRSLAKTNSLSQDASSGSGEGEGEGRAAASGNSSTRTPCFNTYSSDDSEVSSKAGGKMKNALSSNDVGLTSLLKRSRRFKEAQVFASRTQ